MACFDAEFGQGSWKELKYAQTCTEGLFVPDRVCHMANFDPNWSTMVLKGATEYTFCNNFANTKGLGLASWCNVGTYSGHLWCEF